MNFSDRYEADGEVSYQKLDDATVIVHLSTGRIHHTNSTGSRIWELLEDGHSLGEVLTQLEQEFQAPPDQLRCEVEEFVERLVNEKILRPVGVSK